MCGDDVRPLRVMWGEKDGERSVGWGGLHTVLAGDLALRLTVLRGLKEWEHGCTCSDLWGPSQPYKPSQWAQVAEVDWLEYEDGRTWGEMGGGEVKEVKEEREGAKTTPKPQRQTPLQAQAPPPPPQKGKGGKGTTRSTKKKSKRFELDSHIECEHAASSFSSSIDEDSPPQKNPLPERQRLSPP